MTTVKWSGSILWLCTTLSFGCIGPFPDGPDETNGDEGASEPESGASGESASTVTDPTDTDWPGSTDSMGTTDPWPTTDPSGTASASATSISGTATCGDCTDGTDSGYPDDPPQVCGVEIEHDPYWDNTYFCGCEACNVEFNNIVPESGEALLAECECICYEVGCGGSVTGGATGEVPDEGGPEDSGGTAGGETGVDTVATSAGESSDDGGSHSSEATG